MSKKRRERVKNVAVAVATIGVWAAAGFLMVKSLDHPGEQHISGDEYMAEIAQHAERQTAIEVKLLPVEEPEEALSEYTAEELEYLALVIYQEAGADYCSDETRLMVGTVVMNRVADPRFPDSIYEVLTQKGQYGRLHWTGIVWPERASRPAEAHAVARAYECAEKILLGYRAFGSEVIWQAEFVQGSEIVAHQDGIYFCS